MVIVSAPCLLCESMVINIDQLKRNYKQAMAYKLKQNKNPHLLREIAELGATAVVEDFEEV